MRTAAHTASEYDSCGHRRWWTAAASKGLFCLVCIVLILVAVPFGLWTTMAELCFSVDDFIVLFSSNFSNSSSVIASYYFFFSNFSKTAAETASEYESFGHRRCWTAAAWCPYYSCRRRAKPVGLVMLCVYCSRTRCGALCFVDDDGRALFVG